MKQVFFTIALFLLGTICFADPVKPITSNLFDNYVILPGVAWKTSPKNSKMWVPAKEVAYYKKFSTLTEENVNGLVTWVSPASESEFQSSVKPLKANLEKVHEKIKNKISEIAGQEGWKDITVTTIPIRIESPRPSTYILVLQTILIGKLNGKDSSNLVTHIVCLQYKNGKAIMARCGQNVKRPAELSTLKASLLKFCAKELQNAQTSSIAKEISIDRKEVARHAQKAGMDAPADKSNDNEPSTKSTASSYWTPPLGMFRGICTVAMSPFNLVRAFPKTHKSKILGRGWFKWVSPISAPFTWCGVAINLIPCTIETVGDCVMGALDILSLGFLGNEFYSGDVTPWFWERDNDSFLSWEKD